LNESAPPHALAILPDFPVGSHENPPGNDMASPSKNVHLGLMHITRTKEHIMNRRRIAFGSLALAGLVLVPTSMVSADGGKGASFCSDSGRPTGEFAGDIFDTNTYGNAGEVVSWFSQQGIKPGPWGQTVKDFCDPIVP
jgi:hypothetical protein